MRHEKILAILIIFSVSGCAVVAISPEAIGVVTDDAGNPVVAEVEITHKQLTDKTKLTTTDSEGNFKLSKMRVFTPIPFSAIRIWANVKVTAPGYEPYEYEIVGFGNKSKIVELKKK